LSTANQLGGIASSSCSPVFTTFKCIIASLCDNLNFLFTSIFGYFPYQCGCNRPRYNYKKAKNNWWSCDTKIYFKRNLKIAFWKLLTVMALADHSISFTLFGFKITHLSLYVYMLYSLLDGLGMFDITAFWLHTLLRY
jgi:hypothetical protein